MTETMNPRPLVAFDESGNTGQNLMDPQQPVFALASVLLSDSEATELTSLVRTKGAAEVKFSKLRSTKAGQRRLLNLLGSDLLLDGRVRLSVIHKPFMVTTKMVDMLIEEFLHRRGVNLYENRANLGLANMWHAVMPMFCGSEAFAKLQQLFLDVVRTADRQSVDAFYGQVEAMRRRLGFEEFDQDLGLLAATRSIADEGIDSDRRTALDPAIPAFFDLAAQWTAQLDTSFDVVHDESKPLASERERLELVMNAEYPAQLLPGDGPARKLPLLSTGVRFANSVTVPQIQVADLLAGAATALCGAVVSGRRGKFEAALEETHLLKLIDDGNPIWPTDAVTPAELGAGDDGVALNLTMAIAESEALRRRVH